MKIRKMLGVVSFVLALALTACGGAGTPETPTTGNGANGAAAEPLQVQGTNALRFEPETLAASASQAFTVEFNNPSSLPHNWVLVEPGQEETVVNAADASGNVPEGTSGVIVAGGVLQGGAAAETIAVDALEAGSYPYVCTVPGHYQAGMKGTLNVQ